MDTTRKFVYEGIIRFLCVAMFIIGFALVFYHRYVIVPTAWPFQFLMSGLAIAVSYTTFSPGRIKEGIAALVLYFILSSGAITPHHPWAFILDATYIGVMACAVYLYLAVARKPLFHNRVLRVVAAAAIVGICNGLIIPFLSLFSIPWYLSHLAQLLDGIHLNLKVGTMMGLMFGIGAEVSKYLIDTFLIPREAAA